MSWQLRPFEAGDDEWVVALWNQTLARDPISTGLFRRQTLLNPNFQPEGCLLAWAPPGGAGEAGEASETGEAGEAGEAGETVGFVLALAPRVEGLHAGAAGSGRIVALGVLPRWRRQGIGSALLAAALGFLAQQGCDRASVAAHEYYAAGVDAEAYGEGIAFLTRRGFQAAGEAIAMGRQLYDLSWPEEVRASESRLRAEGVEVRPFRHEDTYALASYFRTEFPTWVEFFTRKLDAGHDLDEMVIAVDLGPGADGAAGRVVGYCQHLDADHVGPFGVAAAYRNRGIGSVMLYSLLDRMRQQGHRFAWFGETGRARPYYERAGFHVTRRYTLLRRSSLSTLS